MKRTILSALFSAITFLCFAQDEQQLIEATLMDYIEGTSYNYQDRIKNAFHSEANLYLTKSDNPFWVVNSQEYANWFDKEPGTYAGRLGKILSIQHFNDIAMAKAEIVMPDRKWRFEDMFIMKKLDGQWKIIAKTAAKETSNASGIRIAMLVSNAHYYDNLKKTAGNSFGEIVNAYDTFIKAGYMIDFVSPDGGAVPLVYINTSDPLHKKYLYDQDLMWGLKNTKKSMKVNPEMYKAIYFVGGSSVMFGVATHEHTKKFAETIYNNQGVVAAVCHGTAGIVELKDQNGNYLVSNKTISGYPEAYENQEADYYKSYPFSIQQEIQKNGGKFTYSERGKTHVAIDGRIVTGQNYQSAKKVAEEVIAIITVIN